jgi:hypothetical protein
LIEQKMADLAAMKQALGELVKQCDFGNGRDMSDHRCAGSGLNGLFDFRFLCAAWHKTFISALPS